MRKILLIGAAAASLALGAGAAYASNPNVPSYSPYAIMGGDSYAPANPGFGDNPGYPPQEQAAPVEGRAAYVEPGSAYDYDSSQYMTPEDRTYYSRGR